MYPMSTDTDTSRPRSSYDSARNSYSNDRSQSYYYARPSVAPLLPLEPRPTLHHSYPDGSSTQFRSNGFHGPVSGPTDYQGQRQSLPGLREILSPGPQTSAHRSYGTAWNSVSGPTIKSSNESWPSLAGLHPPLVLPAPIDTSQRYHTQHSKPYEFPAFEMNPVSKIPQSLPVSPYAGHRDANREHADARLDRQTQASTSSYSSNGAPSPFSPAAPDHGEHGRRVPRFDRGATVLYMQAGAENHGQYLGIEDAGEGTYYLYEDGHRIPTQVDGEDVNPAWGLTKANKPRKRLALACLDCREKKVKCEPGKLGCAQCEKAHRPCRKVPEKSSQSDCANNTMLHPVSTGISTSDAPPASNHELESESVSKRRTRADPSPPGEANKRHHRSPSPPTIAQVNASHSREETNDEVAATPTKVRGSPEATRPDDMSWEDDPYALNPELTVFLLDLYFEHIGGASYCAFPHMHFFEWLKTYKRKCQNERMMLYAMLATASIFAGETLSGFGRVCADIAAHAVAVQIGKFNICMAQCRTLLSLYHFAKGTKGLALDYAGAAIRTTIGMRLYTEEGCLDDEVSMQQSRYEFHFSPAQLAECKRRTFWSTFLQARIGGNAMCIIKPEDIFTRLPCTDDMYERGIDSDAPFFSNDVIDPIAATISATSPVANMAWVMLVAAIWGDVVDFVFRATYQADNAYRRKYESFYSETCSRLETWSGQLPEHLQYSAENLDRSTQGGYTGTFVSMHVLHHLSLMKLNRSLRHTVLPGSARRNIRAAHEHGHQLLQIVGAVHTARRDIAVRAPGQLPIFTFTTHFPGYATLAAIDIVGAGGLHSNHERTLDEIEGGLGFLRELSIYWNSARDQLKACEKKLSQIRNAPSNTRHAQSGCWLSRRSLEQEYGSENDCIYGIGKGGDADERMDAYLDAFTQGEANDNAPAAGVWNA